MQTTQLDAAEQLATATASDCDSPPTRPRPLTTTRWQQLKAGWGGAEGGSSSPTTHAADQAAGAAGCGGNQQQLLRKSIIAPASPGLPDRKHQLLEAADTDAADVLKRCSVLPPDSFVSSAAAERADSPCSGLFGAFDYLQQQQQQTSETPGSSTTTGAAPSTQRSKAHPMRVQQGPAAAVPKPARSRHSSRADVAAPSKAPSAAGRGSLKSAAAARPAADRAAVPAPSRSAAAAGGGRGAAQSCRHTAAKPASAGVQTPLRQEASTAASSTSSVCELQTELQLELAAVLMYRVLRRWRLAAADLAAETSRARPMANLLSKRKTMRAWRLALAAHSRSTNSSSRTSRSSISAPQHEQQQQQQQPLPQGLSTTQQRPQSQPQPLTQQHSHGSTSKRLQVACQFHSMYRQHCCLLHWHAWAVAAAQARHQLQEQQQLQERQRALAEQQEQLLAAFQLRQQQELEQQLGQQQARKRHDVAVRFHQLFTLHAALRTWHKHASVSAALSKLHPPLPSAPCGGAAAAAAPAPASDAGSGRARQGGGLDPTVVQHKAEQLLQHLARRAEPQQQQQLTDDTSVPPTSARAGPRPATTARAAAAAAGNKPRPAAHQRMSQQPGVSTSANQAAPSQQRQPARLAASATGVLRGQQPAPPPATQPCDESAAAVEQPGRQDSSHSSSRAALQDTAVEQEPAAAGLAHQQEEPTQPQQPQLQQHNKKALRVPMKSTQHRTQQHQPQRRHSCTDPPCGVEDQQPAADTLASEHPAEPAGQQDWPLQRQRQQQQLRQLQAEEGRRLRQHQQLEQQLQALLSERQWELAQLHADRILVHRVGLKPWQGLVQHRAQQWLLAGRLHQWHLLSAAMRAFKHALLCRHKHHTCRHIQAWGVLRRLHQQHRQCAMLSALHTWALTARHFRRQLLLRALCGWRDSVCAGAVLAAAAAGVMRALRQRQVLSAWRQFAQDQAHEQLLVELELTATAAEWHTARVKRATLHTWHINAASSVQQRLTEAAHQQTWSRVRGWLTELEAAPASDTRDGRGGSQAAGTGGGCSLGHCQPEPASAAEVAWDWDLEVGGSELDCGDGACEPCDAVSDLAALAEWFEAAGRDLPGDSDSLPGC